VDVTMPPIMRPAVGFVTADPIPDSREYWSEAGNDGGHSHQFRANSLNGTVNGSLLDIRSSERLPVGKSILRGFVQVYNHYGGIGLLSAHRACALLSRDLAGRAVCKDSRKPHFVFHHRPQKRPPTWMKVAHFCKHRGSRCPVG